MEDSYVCSGAMMKCTMGTSPARLTVLPIRTVFLTGQPMANISDHQTMVNLAPFGLCRSLAFPATASATAAALGTLTPMPCMHNTPFPWMGGKMDYLVKGQPALLKSCKCQCLWGGTISIVNDGQVGEGTQWVEEKPFVDFPKEKNKDVIILVDAYWEKEYKGEKMKIRFIPHQMDPVDLVVVFAFKYDDEEHDKSKAVFSLKFDIPNTIYKNQHVITIKGDDLNAKMEEKELPEKLKSGGRNYYKYLIEHFTSDLKFL